MRIYPAVDLLGAKAVRLYRGDYEKATVYAQDPVQVAMDFRAAGAEFLHIVDLDGAKSGGAENFEVIREMIAASGLRVQTGGGIRSRERIETMLRAGAERVILGTAALEDPDFLQGAVREYGDKIAVGVDAKDGRVATRGWLCVSETDATQFVQKMRDVGVKTVIYTDISRDGTLAGADAARYRELVQLGGIDIIASGGIADVQEITALKRVGVAGAILGKSLYSGKIALPDALRLARED